MKEVIKACRKGNRAAQERVYYECAPKVMGICRRYSIDAESAKDVMQDAFINIFTSLKKQKGIQSLDAWISRVTVNTAINHFKKNK